MSERVIDSEAGESQAKSRGRLPIVIGLGVLALGVSATVGVFAMGGSTTTEDALRSAATDYNNAMVGKAPAKNLLAYAQASCTDKERDALVAAPALAKAFAPGVTGFQIAKVTITGSKAKVYVEPTGPGAAAIKNITDTGNPDLTADQWALVKGKWFRADC